MGVNVVEGILNHRLQWQISRVANIMKNSKVVENILRFVTRWILIKPLSIQHKECGYGLEDSLN